MRRVGWEEWGRGVGLEGEGWCEGWCEGWDEGWDEGCRYSTVE